MLLRASLLLLGLLAAPLVLPQDDTSTYAGTLKAAERHLAQGHNDKARELLERVLERDHKAVEAWDLRARWAQAVGERDEEVYALHQALRLARVQGAADEALAARRARLVELDPVARELFALESDFLAKLMPVAERYEAQDRPHSAIRVLKQVLALDPENAAAQAAIERIASKPDPSLAGDAKPRDLFEGVSEEWIREHDAAHATWEARARLERENYTTYSDAGYEVLVRAAEAMEQMNAFYREFFRYGTEEDGHAVPKIGLNIFKSRDEYLKLGIGPPVEWSAGHFTGNYVECYIGAGGFEEMTGTLFHEAAHQFVSLATSAAGWLNEGLASFFEGTRILPNGTVLMNMPASHRLFPLAERMERGWMSSASDGLAPDDPNATPSTAPTFRIVLENEYAWGPPWYAPTWGVVYFLYNYQDPVDGRFVYRAAFQDYLDKSGGRSGDGAVEVFEETVLAHPLKPLKGVEGAGAVKLPRTVEELDAVWKDWCLALRDELAGTREVARPYLAWGRYAAANGLVLVAKEHFEKGLAATPDDPALLEAFAELLAGELKDDDRAAKLVLEALRLRERETPPDEVELARLDRWLGKLDPKHRALVKLREDMAAAARTLVAHYEEAGLPMMVMDTAWRLGTRLELEDLFVDYERAVRACGKSLAIWDLAYNERDLEGWNEQGGEGAFRADGPLLQANFGAYDSEVHDYQFLTLDQVTSGDFSMEAKLQAERGEVGFAGFVFGQKSSTSFHGLFYVPGRKQAREGTANPDYVDLMSSFGGGAPKIWRHEPIPEQAAAGGTSAGSWRTLRLDVSGATVDFWLDGELCGTHEFASREVLQGKFGLVLGRGHASFRDVRYLARDGRDRASAIERELRMEPYAAAPGQAVGYSWIGQVPPFPHVERWVQGARESWVEHGPAPQLLVLFSQRQNDFVPIDGWLRALAETTRALDLGFVCVADPNDSATLAAYLADHALPGDVAVDFRAKNAAGIGATFEAFFVDRFNLPRVLLLDVDQKVVWEGDPGVILGEGYAPPFETYVDAPLEELVEKRGLARRAAWRAAWDARGLDAMARGDLAAAAPLLAEAAELDGAVFPEVARAQARRAALLADLDDVERVAAELEEAETEPALEVLLDWSEALGRPLDAKARKPFKRVLDGKRAKAWTSATKAVGRYVDKPKLPHAERLDALLERLGELEGRFPRELAADLTAARDDEAACAALCAAAADRPRLWLARRRYGW
ncbi:MAG: hypothetical protein H6828_15400 [Planctomycetes bacterium]|nr:hypothetical protein [Planctomycetota bacterium]